MALDRPVSDARYEVENDRHLVDATRQLLQFKDYGVRVLGRERLVDERQLEFQVGLWFKLRRVGGSESEPHYFHFTAWVPSRATRWLPLLDDSSIVSEAKLIGEGNRGESYYGPVLVGVRQSVDQGEGSFIRSWTQVEGLHAANLTESELDPSEGAFGRAGGADGIVEPRLVCVDRELVVFEESRFAGFDECGNGVVECAPQVVHQLSKDDGHSQFGRLLTQFDTEPPGVWVEVSNDGMRLMLMETGTGFSIEQSKVVARTFQLCSRCPKVKDGSQVVVS